MDYFIKTSSDVILKVLTQILEKNFKFSKKTSVLDHILLWN